MDFNQLPGVLVTCNPQGKIIARVYRLSCPSPHDFPFTREDGTVQHFFPGASLTRFRLNQNLVEKSHG